MVESLFLKPNWVWGIAFLSLMNTDIRLTINFSHNLAKKGRRLIERLEEGFLGNLPGFGIKIITEIFHWKGKYDNLNIELRTWVS
jgi:hypothetical protein